MPPSKKNITRISAHLSFKKGKKRANYIAGT